MTDARKFVIKNNGRISARILCDDCCKVEIRQTVEAGIYSEEATLNAAEFAALEFPWCDICEASFKGVAVPA